MRQKIRDKLREHEREQKEDRWKYGEYDLAVDPLQGDKAVEIRLCMTFQRPHMRAFHYAWWAFFVAFFMWFAILPLIPEIRRSVKITNDEYWTSTIANFSGTFFIRLMLGPLCDRFGPRILFGGLLCFVAIPTACTGLIQSAQGLITLRLFIGFAGGSFVMCEHWVSNMFAKEVVGTACAMAAGWGNLGAGVTQLIVGKLLFPAFVYFFKSKENPEELAWRTVCLIPAIVSIVTGVIVLRKCDDCPLGNYADLRKNDVHVEYPTVRHSTKVGFLDINSWLLFIQYAACFGVELAVNSAAAIYFRERFGLSLESSAAVAALFGYMNLFARGMGGALSDTAMNSFGMRGRLIVQFFMLICEGTLVLILQKSESLTAAIGVLVVFSFFVQAAEGATYGIVPYVSPAVTGCICGIVGAGGTAGAVVYTMAIREWGLDRAFELMGYSVLLSSILTVFIHIKGHSGLLWGEDLPHNSETGELIEGLLNEEEVSV